MELTVNLPKIYLRRRPVIETELLFVVNSLYDIPRTC